MKAVNWKNVAAFIDKWEKYLIILFDSNEIKGQRQWRLCQLLTVMAEMQLFISQTYIHSTSAQFYL